MADIERSVSKPLWKRALKGVVIFDLFVVAIAQIAKRIIPEVGQQDSDMFQLVSIMDGRRWASTADRLRSGTVITAMGGTEIDLRKATLDPDGAHLRLFTIMGGVEVRVPSGWQVRVKARAFMGANDFKRASADLPSDAPVLDIEGGTLMAGVTILPVPSIVV